MSSPASSDHWRTCPFPTVRNFNEIQISRWQRFKARWFGPVYLGMYDMPHWPMHNACFLDRCEYSDCGAYFVRHMEGQEPARLQCPNCGARRYLLAARFYRLSGQEVRPFWERLLALIRTIPPG